jgi:imidazole glycerol-phosphate synthase subunit HisH
MIGVIDAGLGNIGSLLNMLDRIGAPARAVTTREDVLAARALILPGVGSFDHGMARLHASGLVDPVRQRVVAEHVPLLGVCLGMQLLGRASEEGAPAAGLDLIPATTRRLNIPDAHPPLRLPHMGWNECRATATSALIPPATADGETPRFYFVHSYQVIPDTPVIVAGWTTYGRDFCAAVQHGNIYGVQFHPEKSHRWGKLLLARFAALAR